jgi:hypothetical protein
MPMDNRCESPRALLLQRAMERREMPMERRHPFGGLCRLRLMRLHPFT